MSHLFLGVTGAAAAGPLLGVLTGVQIAGVARGDFRMLSVLEAGGLATRRRCQGSDSPVPGMDCERERLKSSLRTLASWPVDAHDTPHIVLPQ